MSPRTFALRSDRGFTLVEILVSFMIFSLVLLPLTAVMVAEFKFERTHEQKLIALMVAKNEIERTKSAPGILHDEQYVVEMAGKRWSVNRTIENSDLAFLKDSVRLQKAFIIMRVGREHDSITLADLRVLKETYR